MSFNPEATNLSGMTDVSLSNPQNSQVLAYDDGAEKWQNQAAAGGDWSNIANKPAVVAAGADQAAARSAIGVDVGYVRADDFPGSTDDERLTAALAYAAAQPYKPAVMLPVGRLVTYTQTQTLFSGMKLIGPGDIVGWQNIELSGGTLNPVRIRLNVGEGSSAWLAGGSGNIYNVFIGNLAFESSNGASQFLHYPVANGTLFACTFHRLAFNGFKHVLGRPADPLSITLTSLTGEWMMNTAYGTQATLAGSDNDLWVGGTCNVGGRQDLPSSHGEYLLRLATAKSNYGPVYLTADNGWRAILAQGSMTYQAGNRIYGMRIEGRNATDPSLGALMRVTGGGWQFQGIDLNYAMTQPDIYGTPDRGMIHMTGGVLHVSGVTVARANDQAESVPILYAAGGEAIIRAAQRSTKGGSWVGRPIVQQSQEGFVIDHDPTITLVSGAATITNTAEGGTASEAVTVGNSGGASGHAWSLVDAGSGTVTFVSAGAIKGARSYQIAGASGSSTFVEWNTDVDINNQRTGALRWYAEFAGYPSGGISILRALNSAGTGTRFQLLVMSDGKLQLHNATGSIVWNSSGSIPLDEPVRFEVVYDCTGSNSDVTVRAFAGDSPTPIAGIDATTTSNFGTSGPSRLRWGKASNTGTWAPWLLDDIAFRPDTQDALGSS